MSLPVIVPLSIQMYLGHVLPSFELYHVQCCMYCRTINNSCKANKAWENIFCVIPLEQHDNIGVAARFLFSTPGFRAVAALEAKVFFNLSARLQYTLFTAGYGFLVSGILHNAHCAPSLRSFSFPTCPSVCTMYTQNAWSYQIVGHSTYSGGFSCNFCRKIVHCTVGSTIKLVCLVHGKTKIDATVSPWLDRQLVFVHSVNLFDALKFPTCVRLGDQNEQCSAGRDLVEAFVPN